MSDTNPQNLPEKKPPTPIEMNGRGVHLATLEDAFRFAKYVVVSGLAPRAFDTPEKVLVAIQYGAELGLSPLRSLNSVAVVNGRPSLWGDALPGLVQASGKCEYIREKVEGEGDGMVAICESKRKDQSEPLVTRFGVADAKRADLWGKAGPWKNYPQRMLKMRARAWNLRDNFADALSGLAVAEEIQDYEAEGNGRQPFDASKARGGNADGPDPLLAAARKQLDAQDAEWSHKDAEQTAGVA